MLKTARKTLTRAWLYFLRSPFRRRFISLFKGKVDFIVCGTQKGGTTALNAYFKEHAEICMACIKEVHYFDRDKYFANGKPNYAKYHSFFAPNKSHTIIGEATPIYMYWEQAPKRIFDYRPDIKIILILRNPIERAYSHWNMERSNKKDSLSFSEAIRNESQRCKEAHPSQHRLFSYIDRGHYLDQIKRIWKYFPKEQVLILKNEDLKSKPNETLASISDFLGIANFKNVENKDVHSTPYVSKLSSEDRDYLRGIFEPGIKQLEKELNWDCSDWLK